MAKKESKKKFNFGSGIRHRKDWINVDINPDTKPDIVLDISKLPLPFPDNCADEIECSHIVEHIRDITAFLLELYRIASNGCIIHIRYPVFTSRSAYADPTHVHYMTHASLDYYEDVHLTENHRIFPKHLKLRKIHKEVRCFFLTIKNERIMTLLENLRIPVKEVYVRYMVLK